MPDRTTPTRTPSPRRRPSTRKYLTPTAERIIADCYPGQVLAAVLERAVRALAVRDGLLTRRTPAAKAPPGGPGSPLAAPEPMEAPRVLPDAPDGS